MNPNLVRGGQILLMVDVLGVSLTSDGLIELTGRFFCAGSCELQNFVFDQNARPHHGVEVVGS